MSDKVYKKVRVTGCSKKGLEEAITLAVTKTAESVRGVSWFELVEVRGAVADGTVGEWQVTLDLGFKVE